MSVPADPVLVRRDNRVLVITLNRPHARNAVNGALASGLEAAIDELESDDDLWAAVLTAAPPMFCAGADLKAMAAGQFTDLVTERGGFAGFVRRDRSKPVIAALAGDALAGGLEIAIACDLVVAGEDVRMGVPEAAHSLLAVGGALANLPQLIGEKPAMEMVLAAEPWPATRLASLGLISRTVANDAVEKESLRLAGQICGNAPLAVRAARSAVVHGRDRPEADRWTFAERELATLQQTRDFTEGLQAFIDKRAPVWTAT